MSLFPTSDQALGALGQDAARLLSDGLGWMVRRKEAVTLIDDTLLRRQMSVDYTLPLSAEPLMRVLGEPVYYAPLLFLQKGSDVPYDPAEPLKRPEPHFANFDFRDGAGKALSLPSREWNSSVSASMLDAIVQTELLKLGFDRPDLRPPLQAILSELCQADQLTSVTTLADLRAGRSRDNDGRQTIEEKLLRLIDEECASVRRMLDVCAIASVVMVPLVGETSRRGILKLSYDEQFATLRSKENPFRMVQAGLGWRGYDLWVESPFLGAKTYHFELHAPEGLEVYDAGLVRIPSLELDRFERRASRRTEIDRASGAASRIHLYAQKAPSETMGFAWVRLRVRRQEFLGGAAFAATLVAIVLWVAHRYGENVAVSPGSVPSLLLLLPGGLAAYAARPGVHRLTSRMLRWARRLVGVAALLPFSAAAFLALAKRDTEGQIIGRAFLNGWRVLAVIATIIAVVLIAARLFPQPRIQVQRWVWRFGLDISPTWPPPPERDPWLATWDQSRAGRVVSRILDSRVTSWTRSAVTSGAAAVSRASGRIAKRLGAKPGPHLPKKSDSSWLDRRRTRRDQSRDGD